jgi:endonuclease III
VRVRDLKKVKFLVEFLRPSFPEVSRDGPVYQNMAALLADLVLQAAINYEKVVAPRVNSILERYPACITTANVVDLICKESLEEILNWKGRVKLERFRTLLAFLVGEGIDDTAALAEWISRPASRAQLLAINGLGAKSVDYLKLLCGVSSFPIDRHIFRFIALAGVSTRKCSYVDAQMLLLRSCEELNLCPSRTENAIWTLMRDCA